MILVKKQIVFVILFILSSAFCPLSSADDAVRSLEENPDVESQLKGDYPPLERTEAQPLGAIQHAWDQAQETAGIYTVVYSPREVIRCRMREYMTTTIVLPLWERADELIIGDEGAYEVKKLKPHLIRIRPKEFVGIDSTLTVIGASGRVYSFYLRSEGYNSKHVSDVCIYVKTPRIAHFSINQDSSAESRFVTPDYLEDAYVNPSELNFAFSMRGDAEIAPERVYSDGIRTWFDYGTEIRKKSLPTIYKVEDGIDTPINVNREGNKLVAQAVGDFALKHGNKVVCITADK